MEVVRYLVSALVLSNLLHKLLSSCMYISQSARSHQRQSTCQLSFFLYISEGVATGLTGILTRFGVGGGCAKSGGCAKIYSGYTNTLGNLGRNIDLEYLESWATLSHQVDQMD
jgi:hypothetical protein